MKKRLKKLEIQRETLHRLDVPALKRIEGGAIIDEPEVTLWCPDTKCSNCSGTKPCCLQAN